MGGPALAFREFCEVCDKHREHASHRAITLVSDRPGDYYDDYGDKSGCETCGGEGWLVVCIDDMCRGAGECMHGDGEIPCPDCDP